jgi:hypothetical protein
VASRFCDECEVGIELVGYDSLVLPVVVADTEVSFRDDLDVDRPAIFEGKIETHEQGRKIVFCVADDHGIPAAAQLSEAAFDQGPTP